MKKESIKKISLATILCASAIMIGIVNDVNITTKAQGVSVESTDLLTSNLLTDGGFENITADDTGKWVVDTTSEAAGSKGSFEVVTDAHTGNQAITLKGAGNDSGYPEISQKITVLPNTTYYIAMRVKNNNTSMSSANMFFGFASETRENEKIYGEQHRWADNSVDKDKIYKDEEGNWSAHNGYSLYSARIKTGNETNIRFYVRVQKMNVTIDDISVTYATDIVSATKENLLKNSGFEDSNPTIPLKDWEVIGELPEGFSAGIDDVRTTSAYVAGNNMQDKQIEGCNALYLVAQSGAEGQMSIGQPVTVTANTNYAFYANFSKWGEVKETAGVQKAKIGILAADKETVLTQKTIDGSDVSLARYMLASVVANVGENTTVYPFITAETKGFGTYGAGLYVDECYFFEAGLDVASGKTNILSNGALKDNSDGWYEVGGSSQLGWEDGINSGKAFASNGNIWLSQWSPLDGIVQSANLEAEKLYKVTAYMRTYFAGGDPLENQDGLYSPVSIMVISGDDETVSGKLYSDDSTDNLTVVAKQNVRLERDDAYMPISLIFSVPTTGTYSIFVGFEGGVYEYTWQGGVQIGGVSMYETSMEELSVIEEDNDYSQALVNTSSDVTLAEETITLAKAMTVAQFNEVVYAAPDYTMSIVDAENNTVTSGDLASGYKVIVKKGEDVVATYTLTVPVNENPGDTSEPTSTPNEEPKKGCKGSVGGSLLALLALGGTLLLKKRR